MGGGDGGIEPAVSQNACPLDDLALSLRLSSPAAPAILQIGGLGPIIVSRNEGLGASAPMQLLSRFAYCVAYVWTDAMATRKSALPLRRARRGFRLQSPGEWVSRIV